MDHTATDTPAHEGAGGGRRRPGRAGIDGPAPAPIRAMQTRRPVGDRLVDDDLIWLRDGPQTAEVLAYLTAERAFYQQTTAPLRASRESFVAEAESRIPAEYCTPSWTVAEARYFFRWRTGSEFEELVRRDGRGTESVVLRVGDLTTTGYCRLGDCVISPDGRWLAYSVDTTGDEVYTLHIRDLTNMLDLDPAPTHTYYGLVWLPDSTGLVYVGHDLAYRPHEIWLHRIAELAHPDVLLLTEPDERFHLSMRSSGDGRYLVVRSAARTSSEEWLIDLATPHRPPRSVQGRRDGIDYTAEPYSVDGDLLALLITNEPTGAYRLLTGPLGSSVDTMQELLPQVPTRRLRQVERRDRSIIVTGRQDGDPRIWLLSTDNHSLVAELAPDEPGGHLELTPYDSDRTGHLSIATQSRRLPEIHYCVDPETGECRETSRTATCAYRPDEYRQDVLQMPVRDGASVPVTVLRRRSTPLDGTAPCLLYGYGAWEHVIEPRFNPALLSLLDVGVVFAHAHVRGGGELGHQWWLAGRMNHKQQTFDDFIDVADGLAAELVDGKRIVARGLSAGGLLMGAAYSQAPTRWAGVVAESPFVDPITTMSDPTAPLVIVEREEWGDPRRDEDRTWMLGWAPYDNVPPTKDRPPLLVTSAIHDPRVSVWEPARWVARLRTTGTRGPDALFRCELGAGGHWPPPGRHQRLAYEAEILAWVADRLLP